MSHREVHVTFVNKTHSILTLYNTSLPHGEWIERPPNTIYPGQTVTWRTDSNGIATGTEGKAYYRDQYQNTIQPWWDDPFIGVDLNAIYFNGDAGIANNNSYYGGFQSQRGNREYVTFTVCECLPNWMEKFWFDSNKEYKHTYLFDLMIPGTHDSGSYGIVEASPISPDADINLQTLNDLDAARWSKAQSFNITQQLNAGIRYFDIRVAKNDNGELFIVHGKYSILVVSLLDAVASFSDRNSYEIIILDFNHFYQMDSSSHDYLANLINQKIGNRLFPFSLRQGITPQTMWNNRKTIIINYGRDKSQESNFFDKNPLWHDSVQSYWPNTSDINTLITRLDDELQKKDNDKLWVMQCILTLQSSDWAWILKNVFTFAYPNSLIEWEGTTNYYTLPLIKSQKWVDAKVNIVICNSFESSQGFCDAIVRRYYESGRGLITALSINLDGSFDLQIDHNKTLRAYFNVQSDEGIALYRSILEGMRNRLVMLYTLTAQGQIESIELVR